MMKKKEETSPKEQLVGNEKKKQNKKIKTLIYMNNIKKKLKIPQKKFKNHKI
jgi:hypothetical protein